MNLCPYLFCYNNFYRAPLTYKPVTAYTATQPILVNDININAGAYPVLNYQPPNTQYPYIYVPIAEFSRVGAKVTWDESKMLLSVITDYYTDKKTIADQQAKINELQNEIDILKSLPPGFQLDVTSIEGVTDTQRSEINNLIETKSINEINALYGEAYNQADSLAKSKGGEFTFGTGLSGDFRGASFGFSKNNSYTNLSEVKIHSNDPDLETNYGRYTPEQLARFSEFVTATFYIVMRDLIPKLQAM